MKSVWVKFRWNVAVLSGLLLVVVLGGPVRSRIVYAAQETAPAPAVLTVEGAGLTTLSLTAADLDKMPRATVALTGDGTTSTYEGVLLYDILGKAGWKFGRGMAGKGMASYLIGTAKDGYQVLFSLAELDPQFSGEKIIIADKLDGMPLPAVQQPFRIVVPGDKAHARSMFSLLKIDVVRLRP